MSRAVSAHLLSAWRDIRPGTRVVVDDYNGGRFESRTTCRAFEMPGGVAVVRVDGCAALARVANYYPLERVHLAGPAEATPPPVVSLATALDPQPEHWTTTGTFFTVMGGLIGIYLAGLALSGLVDWIAR